MSIGELDWCEECRQPVEIVDDSIESAPEAYGDRQFRVITLACEHQITRSHKERP